MPDACASVSRVSASTGNAFAVRQPVGDADPSARSIADGTAAALRSEPDSGRKPSPESLEQRDVSGISQRDRGRDTHRRRASRPTMAAMPGHAVRWRARAPSARSIRSGVRRRHPGRRGRHPGAIARSRRAPPGSRRRPEPDPAGRAGRRDRLDVRGSTWRERYGSSITCRLPGPGRGRPVLVPSGGAASGSGPTITGCRIVSVPRCAVGRHARPPEGLVGTVRPRPIVRSAAGRHTRWTRHVQRGGHARPARRRGHVRHRSTASGDLRHVRRP